jgi:hypothetical protein
VSETTPQSNQERPATNLLEVQKPNLSKNRSKAKTAVPHPNKSGKPQAPPFNLNDHMPGSALATTLIAKYGCDCVPHRSCHPDGTHISCYPPKRDTKPRTNERTMHVVLLLVLAFGPETTSERFMDAFSACHLDHSYGCPGS